MPSEKVVRILRSKSELSEDEINNLSEQEAWAWIYGNRPTKSARDSRNQICFTGFRPSQKESLSAIAEESGMKVVKSVTQKLCFLCIGEYPGPSKLEKASKQNATILTREEFLNLTATGEVPNAN